MSDSHRNTETLPQHRRFLQFRLRTLLVVVAVVALILGAHVHRMQTAQRQHHIVTELNSLGAITQYEYVQDENWNSSEKWYPDWLERWVGQDYLYGIDAFVIVSHENPDEVIERAADLPDLRLVKLPACTISDDSLRPLEKLHRLEWLELFATPVTDDCMESIVKLKTLKTLDLRGTKVTDQSITAISSLPHLTRLNIGNTAITPAGIDQLREALPDCTIDTETQ
jgi:Leucine-rich repeat (LRR) protein